MKKLIVMILFVAFGSLALATQDSKDTGKEKCLECHGPFEKIAKATENWKAPSGETATPHRYVAHDTKDIPECIECHQPHALPLQDKSKMVKANIDFCYNGCHHSKNLQPCKSCH